MSLRRHSVIRWVRVLAALAVPLAGSLAVGLDVTRPAMAKYRGTSSQGGSP